MIKGIFSRNCYPAFTKEAQTPARVVFIAEGKNKKVKYLNAIYIYVYKRCIYIEWCVYLYVYNGFIWHNFLSVQVLQNLAFSHNQLRLCWEINNAHCYPTLRIFPVRLVTSAARPVTTCSHGAELVTCSAPHQCTLGAVGREFISISMRNKPWLDWPR